MHHAKSSERAVSLDCTNADNDEHVCNVCVMDGERTGASRLWSRKVVADIAALCDTVLIVLSGLMTAFVYAPSVVTDGSKALHTVPSVLVLALLSHELFWRTGRYRPNRLEQSFRFRLDTYLALAAAFGVVLLLTTTLGGDAYVSLNWYPLWFSIAVVAVSGVTGLAGLVVSRANGESRFSSRIAVYGSGRIARRLLSEIARAGGGRKVVGIYEDRAATGRADVDDIEISGGFSELIEAGRQGQIDEVIIALPADADKRIAAMALRLEQLPVDLSVCTHFAGDFTDDRVGYLAISHLGNVGLLRIRSKPLRDWGPILKRTLDAVLAPLFLLLLSPVMLGVAIVIRLDSPGPIFFHQRRHGLNHRVIEVLKFRTMRAAEEAETIIQASRQDSRVTRVGWFLRRTSIDELPQLINVIRGEMSLVGPRPHAIVHNQQYSEMLERYANRHKVKPGITGWAQINGFRGETKSPKEMENRVRYDMEYIDGWSLWTDLKIIIMTPIFGLIGKKAY